MMSHSFTPSGAQATHVGDVDTCNECMSVYPYGGFHTCPLTEAELREQIAKEIQAHAEGIKFDDARISAFYYAAAIARGQK